ncbi:amidohydrolase family protein (macronuclear) [Tetrahymena thermophila SB210]|uniref:Amidohydrolase family protein n=1 Tax=Tetrahymena thermophila (strain SB210) TaxID=312017 RepID=Q23RJ8_TETTS|nr:amidohydrolase family protein [Tetrahymena thermophila SB210]EAR99050.1 amidohydrolase family protein [Tetrahymena thermophila SB210]|eukprot:XP_001019295.1 amidohydrolase family protein [Tetrahymena thermophila SB210]
MQSDQNIIKLISDSEMISGVNKKFDLSITSTKVLVGEDKFQRAVVCTKNEKIVSILIDPTQDQLEEIRRLSINFVNYGNKYIMSGIIDMNVSLHSNYEEKEWCEIQNLTRIALAGGVTMVVNNPLLENEQNIVELNQSLCDCREKIEAMREESFVDFAQLTLLTKTNCKDMFDKDKIDHLKKYIVGFRTYFSPSFQPDVDYCSNKSQILQFIDQIKNLENMSIFFHPIYLQCEKELGVTSPMRNLKIKSRVDIQKTTDCVNEKNIPCSDAVLGETHEEERWSSIELESIRNDQIQQKLLKIFPMAQQKTMQSALKLLSIQEKSQYLCQSQIDSGENNKSDEGESQNEDQNDKYLEFKRLNDAKHSFLSIESEDENINNQQKINPSENTHQKQNNLSQKVKFVRPISINLDSSKFINICKNDHGQSFEELTETSSMTTYRNSLSPQKDQSKPDICKNVDNKNRSSILNNMEQNNIDSKPILKSNVVQFQNEIKPEDSPSSLFSIRPKSNSNLLIRRKLQQVKNENNSVNFNSMRKVHFLVLSNSNLCLPACEQIEQSEGIDSNKGMKLINSKTQTNLIDNSMQQIDEKVFDQGQGISLSTINIVGEGFTRIRSQTSSNVLSLKQNTKDLEKKQKTRRDYLNFLTFRPPFWENIAINFFKQKFVEYKQNKVTFQPNLIFTNVSNSYSVAKIFRQKLRNPNFNLYIEVSTPFLYFDSSNINEGETKFKNEPAIYDKLNKKLLLSELEVNSVIDCVGSNHFYVPLKYKPPDFTVAFNGLNSIGGNLYTIWTLSWINLKRKFKEQINQQQKDNHIIQSQTSQSNQDTQQKGLVDKESTSINYNEQIVESTDTQLQDINENKDIIQNESEDIKIKTEQVQYEQEKTEEKIIEISKLLSINPSKILGIQNQKGQIKEGLDADFVVWDPFEKSIFDIQNFQLNQDISSLHIYDKKVFYGKIYSTIIRGNILYNIFESSADFQDKKQNELDQKENKKKQLFQNDMTKEEQIKHLFKDKSTFKAKLITKI